MLTIPHKYQHDCARMVQKFGGRALIADEMGLGKSLEFLLWRERYLFDEGVTIVVCPAAIKWNWQRECYKHFGLRAEVLEGRKPPRVMPFDSADVYIINYDILPYWIKWLRRLKPKLIGVDECQYIKSRKAKRTRAVRKLCRKVPHVICLSGTPLTNRPAELFTTLNLLRPDLYPTFFPFAMRHCAPERTPWGWTFKGATRLKALHRRLVKRVMIRRLKRDVMAELPKKSRHVVVMDINNRKEYDKAKYDFINWLRVYGKLSNTKPHIRAERLVKMGYLKRLAALGKLPSVIVWVENFLSETDGKLILFGVHKKILRPIHNYFSTESVLVDGTVTGRHRQLRFDQFTHDRRTRILVGNIQAAGVGWNGTAASTVAFAEFAWTPGEHTQAEDRINRIGQTDIATCYYLTAKGTLEEDLARLLQKKQRNLDQTLDGYKFASNFDIVEKLEELLLS